MTLEALALHRLLTEANLASVLVTVVAAAVDATAQDGSGAAALVATLEGSFGTEGRCKGISDGSSKRGRQRAYHAHTRHPTRRCRRGSR